VDRPLRPPRPCAVVNAGSISDGSAILPVTKVAKCVLSALSDQCCCGLRCSRSGHLGRQRTERCSYSEAESWFVAAGPWAPAPTGRRARAGGRARTDGSVGPPRVTLAHGASDDRSTHDGRGTAHRARDARTRSGHRRGRHTPAPPVGAPPAGPAPVAGPPAAGPVVEPPAAADGAVADRRPPTGWTTPPARCRTCRRTPAARRLGRRARPGPGPAVERRRGRGPDQLLRQLADLDRPRLLRAGRARMVRDPARRPAGCCASRIRRVGLADGDQGRWQGRRRAVLLHCRTRPR